MASALGSASIFDDVNAGFWDEGLDALAEVIRARQAYLKERRGAQNQLNLQHGDAVRVINIRPKYLWGITGTINKQRIPQRRGDIMVDIDPCHYSRLGTRYGRTLSVPATSLERVR